MKSPRGITALARMLAVAPTPVLAPVLAAVLLTAGCASGHRAAGPARPSTASPRAAGSGAASHSGPAARTLDGCLAAGRARIETVPGAVGGTLTLGIVGTGPRVVVLSNESDENLCSWRPLSARLAASGYRVVLWDYGGGPPAGELAAVVRRLRSEGVTRLVLMGASEGAKASLVAAAQIRPAVQGVVSLSAESVLLPAVTVLDSVRHVHCPLLLVTADQDPYGSAQAARQFLAAAPSEAKRLVTVPGTDHGTALLTGRPAATTRPAITAFLHRVLG
jgi:pimeloyl-ACP methyl ester carboxylesterase